MSVERALLPLCAAALLASCGGDDVVEWLRDDGGASALDAGRLLDASADAAEADASRDVVGDCRGSVVTLPAARTDGRAFSIAVSYDEVFVAALTPSCGMSAGNASARGVTLTRIPTSGEPEASLPFVSAGPSDCDALRLPTLVAHKRAVNLFYASVRAMSSTDELFTENVVAPAGPLALTNMSSGVLDDLAARADDVLELVSARGGLFTVLRAGAVPRPLNDVSRGDHVVRLDVTAVGDESSAEAVALSWISDADTRAGAFLGFYNDRDALSDPVVLTADVGGRSSVALATQAKRAAVVYTDASGRMSFRTLEQDRTLGEPVHLTGGGEEVSDVSIARFSIGYLIAYRSHAREGGQSVVRLLAVDELGHQSGTRFIAETRQDGRDVDVRVANDGRVVVAWAEPSWLTSSDGGAEVGLNIHVARLDCL